MPRQRNTAPSTLGAYLTRADIADIAQCSIAAGINGTPDVPILRVLEKVYGWVTEAAAVEFLRGLAETAAEKPMTGWAMQDAFNHYRGTKSESDGYQCWCDRVTSLSQSAIDEDEEYDMGAFWAFWQTLSASDWTIIAAAFKADADTRDSLPPGKLSKTILALGTQEDRGGLRPSSFRQPAAD